MTHRTELRAGTPADQAIGRAPIIGTRKTGLPFGFVAQLGVGGIRLADSC